MAINEWWAPDPSERYWIEITDRDDLGADLYIPKTDQAGNETWSYSLVAHVQPGDIVLHYWKQPGQEKAIVGYSRATGALESTTIRWQAHGTSGRASGTLDRRPAWRFPLTEFTDLDQPVSLEALRDSEQILRQASDALAQSVAGPLYLPFVFSDKRPLRTAQGYLAKMPKSLLAVIPQGQTILSVPGYQTVPGSVPQPRRRASSWSRQPDPMLRKAVERHAVDWTLREFESQGYLVDDVGDSNPYDVLALNDSQELHIEVKGSTGIATTVELTEGETAEASTPAPYEAVLVVLDQIMWQRTSSGQIVTSGGRARIWRSWRPERDRLVPTRYRYLLPPD